MIKRQAGSRNKNSKPRAGFEPATSSLPRTRYTELSYRGAKSPLCSPFKNLSVRRIAMSFLLEKT